VDRIDAQSSVDQKILGGQRREQSSLTGSAKDGLISPVRMVRNLALDARQAPLNNYSFQSE